MAKNVELRAYVSPDLKRMVKAVVGLKNGGKDWTISDAVAEALQDWLAKPENAEIMERHNLYMDNKE